MAPIPLDVLHANETAQIVDVVGESGRVHQLAEMGLRNGCKIRMVRPGKPCVVEIDGRRLSVRLGDVEILVTC